MNAVWGGILVLVAVVVVGAIRTRGAGARGGVAKEKIKQGALVLDVRTPAEYGSGHYEGARNIPLQDLNSRLDEIGDKTRAIVVYCASGMRSAQAARILAAAGFQDVTNAGGLRSLQ